jgi:hypothetical protein
MTRTFVFLFMICTLGMSASAQKPAERTTLVPGNGFPARPEGDHLR